MTNFLLQILTCCCCWWTPGRNFSVLLGSPVWPEPALPVPKFKSAHLVLRVERVHYSKSPWTGSLQSQNVYCGDWRLIDTTVPPLAYIPNSIRRRGRSSPSHRELLQEHDRLCSLRAERGLASPPSFNTFPCTTFLPILFWALYREGSAEYDVQDSPSKAQNRIFWHSNPLLLARCRASNLYGWHWTRAGSSQHAPNWSRAVYNPRDWAFFYSTGLSLRKYEGTDRLLVLRLCIRLSID